MTIFLIIFIIYYVCGNWTKINGNRTRAFGIRSCVYEKRAVVLPRMACHYLIVAKLCPDFGHLPLLKGCRDLLCW